MPRARLDHARAPETGFNWLRHMLTLQAAPKGAGSLRNRLRHADIDPVALLPVDTLDLTEAEAPVKGDVLDHARIHVEPDLAIATLLRLFLGKGKQPPPNAPALRRRGDGDIRDQQRLRPVLQHDQPNDFLLLVEYPRLAVGDAPGVVVPHRARLPAEARDPTPVGVAHERADGIGFASIGTSYHRWVVRLRRHRLGY
jgi:hypothetical protein